MIADDTIRSFKLLCSDMLQYNIISFILRIKYYHKIKLEVSLLFVRARVIREPLFATFTLYMDLLIISN